MASNIKRRNQIRLLAQNPLPPTFDPKIEIQESKRFTVAIMVALILKFSMKTDEQIIEGIDQWIELISNPKSRNRELSIFKVKLIEFFGPRLDALAVEYDLFGAFWKTIWNGRDVKRGIDSLS